MRADDYKGEDHTEGNVHGRCRGRTLVMGLLPRLLPPRSMAPDKDGLDGGHAPARIAFLFPVVV